MRVATVLPAGAELASILLACAASRATLVPISPRAPAVEVDRILRDCRPSRLVMQDRSVELEGAAAEAGDATILYTSGTTGEPKGVRLTFENHSASALGCQESLGLEPGDTWLSVLSPHHVGGLAIFMRGLLLDLPVVTLARFSADDLLRALTEERVAVISLVPTMLIDLERAGGVPLLRRLKVILLGGAPAPDGDVRRWAAAGLNVCPSYGLTETCSQVATVPPGRALEFGASAGMPHSRCTIEIQDGEIVVGGPVLTPGYVNRTIRPAPVGGQFPTGDLGRLEAGVLHVIGRRDDTIITGGENVHPEEVEAVLRAHPGVVDAAVAGRADARLGHVLEAIVVGDADADSLQRWCRERLPSFKVPRVVTHREQLPRTDGGKLLRREL